MTPELTRMGHEPTFSSRDLAQFAVAVSAEPVISLPFQEEVVFDRVNHMAIDTATTEAPQIQEVSPLIQRGPITQVPDVFKTPYHIDDNEQRVRHVKREPILERTEWLGSKRDEKGNVIGAIEGSVVGRTGQEVIVVHPGNVRENMIKVTSYVRWDPQHPNDDLLHIPGTTSTLILGDTGPEVRIERIETYLEARDREYSGWYNNTADMEEIYTQPQQETQRDTQAEKAQELARIAELVSILPISVKHIDMYPFPSGTGTQDNLKTVNELNAVITVADTYRAHGETIGYLQSQKETHGGRPVNGTVVGKKGEIYYDPETNMRMVRTSTYVLQEPGNMALEQLAKQEGLPKQMNRNDQEEYIITSEIRMSDAVRFGYVFSAFETRNEQELAQAA